jgi:propanol-preferring alcohol dehydrogenase
MRALRLARPAPIETRPLALTDLPPPEPGPGELRVRVEVCGVCRTDLHVVEGDLAPRHAEVTPGHEAVGRVEKLGPGVAAPAPGARVGIAWLHRACGACRFCARGEENLCLAPRFTGWDVDGGYAEQAVVPAAFCYELPEALSPEQAAPLLCAGIIGYRAFRRSGARAGARLGLWGFGASAHIAIQVARHAGCEVYVFSRARPDDGRGRPLHGGLAEELGAAWVGGSFDAPPVALDAAILFAPAGELVPAALERLDRGGTLAVAGIHLSEIPPLDYQRHLFQERTLTSVTANTRADGRELLRLAAEIPIRAHVRRYPLAAANEALADLKHDRVRGAAVLEVAP